MAIAQSATEIDQPIDGVSRASASRPGVLVVGPGPSQVGGVATFLDILLSSEEIQARYELIHLDTTRMQNDIGLAGRLSFLNIQYFLGQLIRLIALGIRCRPKIIHLPVTSSWAFWKMTAFMLVAKALDMRVLMHLHGGKFDQYYRRSPAPVRKLIGLALSRADAVVALSGWWRQFLLVEVRPDIRVEVVTNSVDTMFAKAATAGADSTGREANTILFVGALGRRKGVFDILRAVPLVRAQKPEARFLFVGDEETRGQRREIDRVCAEARLGDTVHFLGLVTGLAKLNLFRQATVFVLPSYGENLPYSLLEAMSVGLPVITTPVGAIPEIVEDGYNGFLVQPGDSVALARRVIQLLNDPALCLSMSRLNVSRILSSYMPEVVGVRFDAIYKHLLADTRR